ncbi:hypothetical protein AMJ99_CH03158 [Rhizobium esperanzae]|nr:hypothetical protein AMJ99_CH03158 [Rhizobium esperanzae]ANM35525.1 hypothetical protein AMK04_CH03162 [Rhizobium sp. N871]
MREQPIGEAAGDDEIAGVLAYHKGDAQAAIGTLLADIRHLRWQLVLTEGAMGHGINAAGGRDTIVTDNAGNEHIEKAVALVVGRSAPGRTPTGYPVRALQYYLSVSARRHT